MKKGIIPIFIISIFLYSCGYRFVGSYSSLPGGVSKVYIENIENLTSEPNIQTYLKSYLINELDLDSRVSVVDKEKADGYVKVKIVSYDVSPSAFKSSGLTSMYRCNIAALVSLKGTKGYIIRDKRVEAYRNYNADSDVSATEKARMSISKEVLKDLTLRIKDALFVNF